MGLEWKDREGVGPGAWPAGFPLQSNLHAHITLGTWFYFRVSSSVGTPGSYLGSFRHLNKEAKPGGLGKKLGMGLLKLGDRPNANTTLPPAQPGQFEDLGKHRSLHALWKINEKLYG